MKVHHILCATFCPFGGKLINEIGKMVCHCLLIEAKNGLILVDTGLGLKSQVLPSSLSIRNRLMLKPDYNPANTALRNVEELGYSRSDVKHILVTHLDFDHVGGLPDFPHAMVHVLAPEHEAAFQPSSFIEKQRYMEEYWNHGVNWQLYNSGGERWFGFEAVRDLNGLPPEILMIPLPGHTRGHSCIAVKTYDGWLLHCGDGYFYHGQVDPHNPHCTKGLEVFQKAFAVDNELRIQNTYRLLDLAQNHGEEVTLFSAHDPCEFEHHQHMVHHG